MWNPFSSLQPQDRIVEQATHPLTDLVQAALLYYEESGIKIEFSRNRLHLMRPCVGQSFARMRDGSSYKDLKKLIADGRLVAKLYNPRDFPEIERIFEMAICGLRKYRKKTYSDHKDAKAMIEKVISGLNTAKMLYSPSNVILNDPLWSEQEWDLECSGQEAESEEDRQLRNIWEKEELEEFVRKAAFVWNNRKNKTPIVKSQCLGKKGELEALINSKVELYKCVFKQKLKHLATNGQPSHARV
ncbi:hypothetical protein [Parachlamydia acanthamoebae]|jgi:hypothetical protein|uniref:Uncharacterized protein n=1 Tax=Parachlamydia acanthamoebae (strain UV7) TaxID=765952 RepID=F8KVX5_PARAV|nr:hypothetical protein [Parachlamydia acanthamoebae]EFB42107.1 hypothetical protein pah_c014o006 [Parachlamydia acanthamoebae str. Hall's coccus]CCB85272.1 putative uncharacterized protein [Parachlamydia acanthamoebae UV-7]